MSNLERLDEAADRLLSHGDPVLWAVADGQLLARFYRSLLANGDRVEWCEEHVLSELSGGRCATVWLPNGSRTPCRMVERLLVDPTTEEGR